MPLDVQNSGNGKATWTAPGGFNLTGLPVTICGWTHSRTFNATGGYLLHIAAGSFVGLGLRLNDIGGLVYAPAMIRGNNAAGFATVQGSSATLTAGRSFFIAGYSPGTAVTSDNSTAKVWTSLNGTVTNGSAAPSAAPGGTEQSIAGNICVGGRHYDAARMVDGMAGSVRVFKRELSTAELQQIHDSISALDSDPDLVFRADMRDNANATVWNGTGTETVVGTVQAGSNGFAPLRHLPAWAGTTDPVDGDWDFTRLADGTLTTCPNEATFAGPIIPTAGFTGALIGTGPYGGKVAYVGSEPADFGANRIVEVDPAAVGRPVVHSQYATEVVVGYTLTGTRGNANQILATAASSVQLMMLNLNRLGLDAASPIAYDAFHRVPSSPTTICLALSTTPVRFVVGLDGAHTHVSFVPTLATSNSIRLGAATTLAGGATGVFTRFHYQRVLLFSKPLSTAKLEELARSLEAPYGLRLYRAGQNDVLVGEGASTCAGTWDSRLRGGLVTRAAARSNPRTIVYNFGVGGDVESLGGASNDMLDDDQDTTHYVLGTLHPAHNRSWLYYIGPGSNACDVVSPNTTTILADIQTLITAAKTAGFDRVVAQAAHPRFFVGGGVDQAVSGTALATVGAGLAGLTGIDRLIPSLDTDYSVTGDHISNPTYYHENPNGIHWNEAGHDRIESDGGVGAAWGSEFSVGDDRVLRVSRTQRVVRV